MAEPRKSWRDEVAEEMIRHIEAGTAPWQKPWRAGVLGQGPHNPVSGKPYQGINRLWLDMQGREDPRWLTYNQALNLGGQVRKGERGTSIEYWKWTERQAVHDNAGRPVLDADGKQRYQEVRLSRPQVFYARVFNAEQVDGLEVYKAPELSFDPDDVVTELIESLTKEEIAEDGRSIVTGLSWQYDQDDRAFYDPIRDAIHMPEPIAFERQYEYATTALHEIAHASGHKSRMNRPFGPFGSEIYAREELRAEMASYIASRQLGLGHYPERHASYLASWLKVLKEDKNELFRAARDADRIVTWLLEPEKRLELEQQMQSQRKGEDMDKRQVQEQSNTAELSERKPKAIGLHPVPSAWQGEACRQFDEEMAQRMGGQYDKAQELFSRSKSAKDRIESIRWGGRTTSAAGAQEEKELQAGVDEAESWLRENVYLNPVIKERMYPVVQNRSINFTDDIVAYLDEMKAELGAEAGQLRAEGDVHQKQIEQRTKIWLNVPFAEKEAAKVAGARWDRQHKSWYVRQGHDMEAVKQWRNGPAPAVTATQNPAEEFASALKDYGVVVKGLPVMDGEWHRASLEDDKPGAANASYRAFLDGRPNAQIKNFKTGELHKWVAGGGILSPEERQALVEQAAATRAMRAEARKNTQAEAARLAVEIWGKAIDARHAHTLLLNKEWLDGPGAGRNMDSHGGRHPYLGSKGVDAHGLRMMNDGTLLVPARDVEGRLHSVQRINEGGAKLFMARGRKEGLMHVIDPDHKIGKEPTIICEGYATGATLHERTRLPVVVAFDSGNLLPVAKALRERYPHAEFAVAADNDHRLENKPIGNVGLNKGREAAEAIKASLLIPPLNDREKADGLTDWNDLQQRRGPFGIRDLVMSQLGTAMQMEVDPKALRVRAQPGKTSTPSAEQGVLQRTVKRVREGIGL